MSRVERLKQLEAKATGRRWSYDGCSLSDFDSENHMTAEWISNGGYEEDADNGERERKDADGELFAALRNAAPALLAVVEAAQNFAGPDGDGAWEKFCTLREALRELEREPNE